MEINNNEILIDICGLTFTYPRKKKATIEKFDLKIKKGEFVLLTGVTGCGKSTVLKMLNGQIPHSSDGQMQGEVFIKGIDTNESKIIELSKIVGMVFQSPEDQSFALNVYEEIAFVLYNRGVASFEIKNRVDEILKTVNLESEKYSSINELSGGQKQRLAIAAVVIAKPEILVLDEPISQLDPKGARKILELVKKLNQELKMTILIVEHRVHEVLELATRLILMDQGRIVLDIPSIDVVNYTKVLNEYHIRIPQILDLADGLEVKLQRLNYDELLNTTKKFFNKELSTGLNECFEVGGFKEATVKDVVKKEPKESILKINNITCGYDGKVPVLEKFSTTFEKGEFITLMGTNGAGKSTLLKALVGLLPILEGNIGFQGENKAEIIPEIGMVLQNPDFMLFNQTVKKEVSFILEQKYNQVDYWDEWCDKLVKELKIFDLLDDFPLALSRGQRLRVAIASALAIKPKVLILDEPTTGQDVGHISDIIKVLKAFVKDGGTVIFCTHDSEVAAKISDRLIIMDKGKVIKDGTPVQVFADPLILHKANINQLPVMKFAKELYNGLAVEVKDVVRYVKG